MMIKEKVGPLKTICFKSAYNIRNVSRKSSGGLRQFKSMLFRDGFQGGLFLQWRVYGSPPLPPERVVAPSGACR